MKTNDKFHPITSGGNEMSIYANNCNMTNKSENLLGTKIYQELNLNTDINEIYKKIGQKLNTL